MITYHLYLIKIVNHKDALIYKILKFELVI